MLLAPLPTRALAEGNYSYSVANGQATITGFNKAYSGPLDIPDTLGGFPVITIGPNAFYTANGITDVTIPPGVATLKVSAFRNCANLRTVAIPASLQVIEGGVFDGCSLMEAFTVDEANPSFSSVQGVLYNKAGTSLLRVPGGWTGSFAIPDGVTSLFGSAFAFCKQLTSIEIPAGFKGGISGSFFRDCPDLGSFVVASSNTAYSVDAYGALFNKVQTRLIRLPSTFAGSYSVPASVTSLDVAFIGCSRLTDINIPSSVLSLPAAAFDRCYALTAINVDELNPNFSGRDGFLLNKSGRVLLRCPNGKHGSLILPDGIADPLSAEGTNSVTAGITNIASGAFAYCSQIGSVTVPSSVVRFTGSSFPYCTSLSAVYCMGDAPVVDGTATFVGSYPTIYYLPGTTNWGPTLAGRPTAPWDGTMQTGYPENAVARFRPGWPYVEVFYNLVGSSSNRLSVMAVASRDNGETWDIPIRYRFGDIGLVAPGRRRFVWRAITDVPSEYIPQMRIRVSTSYGVADTPPFIFNTRGASNATLRAWADRNRNRIYDDGEEIPYAEVYFNGRTADHFKGFTDDAGRFVVDDLLKEGTQVFIRSEIHLEPAVKAGHDLVDGAMYTLWLDSDTAGGDTTPGDGTWNTRKITSSDVGSASMGQDVLVKLSHPVFEWHLVVAVEVSSPAFIGRLQESFWRASEYFFDVSDGQMKFGKIAILSGVREGSPEWRDADMVVHNDADFWPCARVSGIRDPGNCHMNFGTDWMYQGAAAYASWCYRAIAHEFGHYGLGFYDEYLDGNRNQADWDAYRRKNPDKTPSNYGYMDGSWTADEMSSKNDYLPSYAQGTNPKKITSQVNEHDLDESASWYPCWQWIEKNFQTTYSGIPVEIVTPPPGSFPDNISEDRSGPEFIPAPYTLCEFPGYQAMPLRTGISRLGAASTAPAIADGSIELRVTIGGRPAAGARVLRKPVTEPGIAALGRCDAVGRIAIWDLAAGDVIAARHSGMSVEHVVDRADIANGSFGMEIVPPPGGADPNRPQAFAVLTSGRPGLLVAAAAHAADGGNILVLTVQSGGPLEQPPSASVHPANGEPVVVELAADGRGRYTGSAAIGEADGGTVVVECRKMDGTLVSSSTDFFAVGELAPDLPLRFNSRDGWVELNLPAGSVAAACPVTLYSGYLPALLPEGFGKAPVGAVIHGSAGLGETLNGTTGMVNIAYREADLVGVDESSIKLYAWDETKGSWLQIPSTLSVDLNVVSAPLSRLGFLALFADASQDVTPPAPVTDLAAATGTNAWSVALSWTDVGDDGTEGRATAYILKYATSAITSNNWGGCAKAVLNINPESPGSNRTVVLSMPTPGTRYYFALATQDEAGNLALLSNSADAVSQAGDLDADQMSDQWECTYDLNPTNATDAALDADDDGLTNLEEHGHGTNPTAWDTDGDGMGDKWEIDHGLDPRSPADKDGDDDGDSIPNFMEHVSYTDPRSSDSDADGMPDNWEVNQDFDPASTSGDSGADSDPDNDAFPNYAEYVAGTNPRDQKSLLLINIVNDTGNGPRISWHPDLPESRKYTVEGKANLTEAVWRSPTNEHSRFFRVKVELLP